MGHHSQLAHALRSLSHSQNTTTALALFVIPAELGLTLRVELGGALTLLSESDHSHHLGSEARAPLLVVIVIVVSSQRTNLSSDTRRFRNGSAGRRRPAGVRQTVTRGGGEKLCKDDRSQQHTEQVGGVTNVE